MVFLMETMKGQLKNFILVLDKRTFSGEVEWPGTLLEVLHKKCELGMKFSDLTLGIASKGSFGPHPSLFFFPVIMKN